MAINYLILLSRQGKVRLAKWFTTLSPKDKAKIVKDVSQLVLARRTRMCNFLEYKGSHRLLLADQHERGCSPENPDTKIVYRRYASLFFIAGCSSDDNELITLEIIHRYVEQMDKYYGNVCELDIIFSFTKAYYILDEILLAGELQESSKKNVLRCIGQQDSLEDMEYLPLRDFDVVTAALNFSTIECEVKGGCDLYTTKASNSDKKLYKSINNSLVAQQAAQHAALIQPGSSLSPAQRQQLAASLKLSRTSPFGDLGEVTNRRTFAYLIATLNASHPDYDFSHQLRPTDFRRERDLQRVMANIDNTLHSVRPAGTSLLSLSENSSYRSYSSSPPTSLGFAGDEISSFVWSPHMWALIDKEMALRDCTLFSYQPALDPFDGDEAAIWQMHYFIFNKDKKRVLYLYVRGLPLVDSPALAPHSVVLKRHGSPLPSSVGANKRAKYWLGDDLANRVVFEDASDDDFEEDVVPYDPDEDVTFDPLNDFSLEEEESDDYEYEGDRESDDEDEELAHSVRGVSEEVAASMEI
ncbi:Maf1 regulator-domain-containing protein [Hypoxylon sp. FL0890]|nr:Maf1 regulator-domain-containing protein [Hypoxylon sp. FL0890]